MSLLRAHVYRCPNGHEVIATKRPLEEGALCPARYRRSKTGFCDEVLTLVAPRDKAKGRQRRKESR